MEALTKKFNVSWILVYFVEGPGMSFSIGKPCSQASQSCCDNCKLSSTSLADSTKLCASRTSKNRRLGVLLSSDIVTVEVDRNNCVSVVFKGIWLRRTSLCGQSIYLQIRKYVGICENIGYIFQCRVLSVTGNCVLPAFQPLIQWNYNLPTDRVIICWLASTNATFDIAL